MLNDINMEFIQELNPLYAIPIVAVILCAFIVYAFGFKSPVPPPSFEGIEEEKKHTKKRKVKDNQKKEKLIQNEKVNGNTATKGSALPKKKELEKRLVEKSKVEEEKSANVEKKANKKTRLQTEKKSTQEKKKENISHDDFNDDGWVKHVSKKERKNQKKTEAANTETQLVASILNKSTTINDAETTKCEDSKKIEEPSKIKPIVDTNQQIPRKENVTTTNEIAENKNTKLQNMFVEELNQETPNLESQPKDVLPDDLKRLEQGTKSKKKKKKNAEVVASETDLEPKCSPDLPAVQFFSDISALEIKTVTGDLTPVKKVVDMDQPADVIASNVAFDELASLYPEAKEAKKKKKVRRDH